MITFFSEREHVLTKNEKASFAWLAITAILILKRDVICEDVISYLEKTPKPHVIAVQFILLGSGFATTELVPDGVFGLQSQLSLNALYCEVIA